MKHASIRRRFIMEDVRKRLTPLRGRVLDLGGRRAENYVPEQPAFARIVANIDPAAAPDVVTDANRLPFRDAQFDAVVLVEIVEHLRDPDRALAEVRRVLSPGGLAIITIPFLYKVHGAPDDYQRFTPSGLRRLLAEFEIVEIVPQGGPWAVIATVVRDLAYGARPRWMPRFVAHGFVSLAHRMVKYDSSRRVLDSEMLDGWTVGYLAVGRRPAAVP